MNIMSTKKNSSKATKSTSTSTSSQKPCEPARNAVLAVVNATEQNVEAILGAMKDGERASMDQLTSAVGTATGLKGDKVYPFVSLYLRNRPGVTITTGRQGGVYRGSPAPKPVDPEAQARLTKKLERAEAAASAATTKAAELRARLGTAPVAAPQA